MHCRASTRARRLFSADVTKVRIMKRPLDVAVAGDAATHLIAPELVEIGADDAPHLVGGRCRSCGARSFPRAAVCSECLSEEIDKIALPTEGTLYSYTVVHQAPKGWKVPYALGYVDLPDGVRVLAHIDAPADRLAIDLPVRLDTGIVGADPSGAPLMTYVFVPRQ
jgi:uncharacterized OB-fold protein